MKKTFLLVLPLLFILSCETEDETSGGLVGTWTIQSVTHFENESCSGVGEIDDYINGNFSGTLNFTEAGVATVVVGVTLSFNSFCDDADGTMVNDTTCVYDGDYELTISGFSSNCVDDGGEFDDDNNCIFNFTEEFDYSYDMETGWYCETYNEGSYSNCFEGDDSYGPCSTCGYYAEEEDAQGAYDCITCPEDYEIDVYFDDCTGYCVPTGTAQNPISTSDCEPYIHEQDCGTAAVSENSAILQITDENSDECRIVMLSR